MAGAQLTPTMSSQWTAPHCCTLQDIVDGINSHPTDPELETWMVVHSNNYDYTPWIQLDLHLAKEVHEVRNKTG